MSFYNRHGERTVIERALNSSRSELIIVYGRRGVGKSALLEEALAQSGKPYVFYRATRRTLSLQMEALSETVRAAFPDAFLVQAFTTFSNFLDFLAHRATDLDKNGSDPVVVVIDELPYIAEVDPGLLTVIQHWWDANKSRPNLKIFLAGSYVAFMERQVLNANSPLYNRRTGAMKLAPMDYAESSLFFPNYSPIDKMTAYAILGGLPSYIEQFNPESTIEENVKSTILRRNTYLSEEPDWLLLEDLRRDIIYGSILRVIANGKRKPSDIARAIGKNSAQDITASLETLRELGLVLREVPVTEMKQSRSRNSLYWIADQYLDFWYRFVDPSQSLVTRGLGERLWEQSIAPALQLHISRPTFERASRQYLWRAFSSSSLPAQLMFTELGTWWGNGDREIDIVGLDTFGIVSLFGTCKWTNASVGVAEYSNMLRDISLASADLKIEPAKIGTESGPWLVMFSRAGFSERLRELAAAQNPRRLLLVSLDDMYA